jgi:hypothetical protein
MADTYSTYMELLLMQDGSHPNTWGDLTNTNLSLIDQAMSQVTSVAVSSANYPLTMYPAAQCQARSLAFNVTGTLSGAVAIELPAGYPRLYVFYNQVTNSGSNVGQYPLTVQVGTGTPLGAIVALAGPTINAGAGVANLIYTDGTNVYGAQPPGQFAQLDIQQAFTAGTAWTPWEVSLSGGPAYTGTIDTAKSNQFYIEVPASGTSLALVISNDLSAQLPGQEIQVAISQNGDGGCPVTFPTAVLWPNGITPVFSQVPNATDLVTLTYTYVQGVLTWLGQVALDYGSAGSSGGTYSVKITQNGQDVSVLGLVGLVSGSVTINVTVNSGVTLSATTTGDFGLDTSGLPSGSIVNLYNAGYIVGKGGDGGPGAWWMGDAASGGGAGDQTNNPSLFSVGLPGGAAIRGPGSTNTLNIYNTGHIWGGGGGGGGGGITVTAPHTNTACGGGGGGGAGDGAGGVAFFGGQSQGTFDGGTGTDGLSAPNASAAGTAGTGAATSDGSATAGAGGAGGNWGTAGYDGTGPTGKTVTRYQGKGGAAGAAVTAEGSINTVIAGDIQGTV